MDCLKNQIGILGCGITPAESGLNINALPGITLESIEKIASAEQVSFMGVWRDVEIRALTRFSNEVNAMFRKRYALKSIARSINLGRKINVTETTAGAAQYRGLPIEIDLVDSVYVSSNLQCIHVQEIPIYFLATPSGAVNVKIFDLDLGTELFTTTITSPQEGWNIVKVAKDFDARRIFIAYDATNVTDSVQLAVPQALSQAWDSCVCSIYGKNCNGTIKGATADLSTPYDLTYGSDSFGMSVVFSIKCKYDNIVCNNKSSFLNALWYLYGVELLLERIYTPRMNYWKINKEEAEELVALYTSRFEENLELVVDGIEMDMEDCCLDCNSSFRIEEVTL